MNSIRGIMTHAKKGRKAKHYRLKMKKMKVQKEMYYAKMREIKENGQLDNLKPEE